MTASKVQHSFALEEVRGCSHVFCEIDSALPEFESAFIVAREDVLGVLIEVIGGWEISQLYRLVEGQDCFCCITSHL